MLSCGEFRTDNPREGDTKAKFYIAMEFLKSLDFSMVLALPKAQKLIYAFELMSAVADLHSVGAYHGDIKNHNFMWFPGEPGKLIDFGSAESGLCDSLGC